MHSALSVDLRERVIAAIEAGASRRQATQRFGVGAASAIRWHERYLLDRRRNMTLADPFLTLCCSEKIRVPGGVTIRAGYDSISRGISADIAVN